MEYIEGNLARRRALGTRSCEQADHGDDPAIGEAHGLGIVARDLEPANVLLVDADTPKIVDFGLAKTLEADSNLTRIRVFIGTPQLRRPPEQVEGLTRMVSPAAEHLRAGSDLLSHANQ